MKRTLLFIIFICSVKFIFSQDIPFSQYNSFPLYTNKAFAGSEGCSRIVTGSRLQWPNLDGGYKSYYFSYDQYSRHLRSGFGIEYEREDQSNGFIKNDYIEATFSPHIAIGKRVDSLRQFVIKPAFNIGYIMNSMDYSRIVYGDAMDPLHGNIYPTIEMKNKTEVAYPDFGFGILVYGENFFAGFYYHHATQPDQSYISAPSPLPARMDFHGGYILKGYKWLNGFILTPTFIYEKQGYLKRTDLSLSATFRKYTLGISARMKSAIVFVVGFDLKFFRIGYAYDMNTTYARKAVGSTHEVVLRFRFNCREKKKKIRTLNIAGM